MKQIFYLLILALGLVSCNGTTEETSNNIFFDSSVSERPQKLKQTEIDTLPAEETKVLTDSTVVGSYNGCSDYGGCDSLVLHQSHKMEYFLSNGEEDFKLAGYGTWSMKGKIITVIKTHTCEMGKTMILNPNEIRQYKVINDGGRILLKIGNEYYHKNK